MQNPTPHHLHDSPAPTRDGALPTLALPPVPFARPATEPAAPARLEAPAQLPTGTSIADLMGALETEVVRPHAAFSTDVERRGRGERRREPRSTGDRRDFTSQHLAAPVDGPVDPRPTGAPTPLEAKRPAPIDPIMPELPLALEPSRPYELPSRGISATTLRSTRPNVAVQQPPFPGHAIVAPPAPVGAPEPPTAGIAFTDQLPPAAPAQPEVPAVPSSISSIFGEPSAPGQVGHLHPRILPDLVVPDAGPAGPAMAPGAGLDPIAASVAATPSAWFGGAVHVDDSMLVWNSPGTMAPLAPSVAAMIAPQSGPVATGSGIATTTLAPAPALPALPVAATRGSGRSVLRVALLAGLPAAIGIGIAVGLDRFVL
jgi:hypothetical protein